MVGWAGVMANNGKLQSLDQITELPGVAADEDFFQELEAKRGFFAALRYLFTTFSLLVTPRTTC